MKSRESSKSTAYEDSVVRIRAARLPQLSGVTGPAEFPEWDILKELDRRARRETLRQTPEGAEERRARGKRSYRRRAAYHRVYSKTEQAKKSQGRYRKEVAEPKKKAVRAYMKEHPEEVVRIREERGL